MQEKIMEIVSALNSIKIPSSKIEKDLGFSNGLLSKNSLSQEKFDKLFAYFSKFTSDNLGEPHTYKIYCLKHPVTKDFFYVGSTRQPLELRISGHIGEANSGSIAQGHQNPSKKHIVLREILDQNLVPIIETLEVITSKSLFEAYNNARVAEQKWVDKLLLEGCLLTNRPSVISKLKKSIAPIGELKTANEILQLQRLRVLEEIEGYCNEQGLTPADLIQFHKEGGKKKAPKEEAKNNTTTDSEKIDSKDGLISVEDYHKLPKSDKMRWEHRIRGVTA